MSARFLYPNMTGGVHPISVFRTRTLARNAESVSNPPQQPLIPLIVAIIRMTHAAVRLAPDDRWPIFPMKLAHPVILLDP